MLYANLSAMHRATARCWGPRTAIRYKKYGLYRDISWQDFRARADAGALGLLSLGIKPGDRVAILSENRVEWLLSDMAALAAGCTTVPLHAPLTAQQVHYQLHHSQARALFLSNAHQAEKVRPLLPDLPDLQYVITFDPVEVLPIHQLTWRGLVQQGNSSDSSMFDKLQQIEKAIDREQLATIIYTSGTTGMPKGVMLTHGNLLSNVEALRDCGDARSDDVLLSWLPYSHIYARTVDIYLTAIMGSTLCLAESQETLLANLAETQPTWMTAVPRFYEKVWAFVQQLSLEERKERLCHIFGPRLKRLCSGGAPLPKHIAEAFDEAGVPLLEGYGLTETSPVISFNRLNSYRLGSVGQCLPEVEVRIAEDGEILTRGPHVMKGYWRDEVAKAQAIVDGWFHTGDIGEVDSDGFLSITGRKKDLIITSLGKNIAPAEIERLLISDPLIDQAVVCGDRRPYLSALIVPDFATLQKVCDSYEQNGDDFLTDPRLYDLFTQRVAAAMQAVSEPERVRKFLLLSRPFRLEEDEVTATLKVRRRFILDKFQKQIDELYAC